MLPKAIQPTGCKCCVKYVKRMLPVGLDWIKVNVDGNKLTRIIYMMPILGCVIDQLSTRIGLTNSNLCELNPQTVYLMAVGIWLYVDIIAVIMIILISYLIIKHWKFQYKRFILLFPFTFGVLKIFAGINNIYLYILYY